MNEKQQEALSAIVKYKSVLLLGQVVLVKVI